MNNTPTPETDAVAEKINFGVDIDFARKLERERDEALMDRARGEIVTITINHYEWILRERDEAREENKKFREALEWIAKRYDDSKPMHQVSMDAYEMSCTAIAALRKEDAK